MSDPDAADPRAEAARRIATAQAELARLSPRELDDGSWFQSLLRRHTDRLLAEQGGLLAPWREKHPELGTPDLARRIVRSTAGKAALIGGAAGALVPVTAWASAGIGVGGTAALAMAELAALERLQVRMLLTLGELQGAPLQNDRVRDVVAIYAHLLKIKGVGRAAVYSRQALTAVCRAIGLKFVQRAAVKLAVPIVSVGIGGGMNYLLTRGLGAHAVTHFQALRDLRDPVALLGERPHAEKQIVLSLMLLIASSDGRMTRTERKALRAALAGATASPDERLALRDALEQPEAMLLSQAAAIADPEFGPLIVDLLGWMAAVDGQVGDAERALLERVAGAVGVDIDDEALADEVQLARLPDPTDAALRDSEADDTDATDD